MFTSRAGNQDKQNALDVSDKEKKGKGDGTDKEEVEKSFTDKF
jgi:hypothetical protein